MEQPNNEAAASSKREKLLALEIPEGGIQLDFKGDKVFTLKPMTSDLWLVVRKMGLEMKGLESACMIVNTLKVSADVPDPDVVLTFNEKRALEQAIIEWTEPAEVEIKKNT